MNHFECFQTILLWIEMWCLSGQGMYMEWYTFKRGLSNASKDCELSIKESPRMNSTKFTSGSEKNIVVEVILYFQKGKTKI